MVWMRSPYSARRSSSWAGRRAVAATRSPASRAARARARPRPREEPVMNQVCSIPLVQHRCLISATPLCYLGGMQGPGFQRARSTEAKHVREAAILDAARRLGAKRGIRQVTLTEIAEAVGMHKSALLRYFETREEIFLRLTAEGWSEWSAELRSELEMLTEPAPGAIAALFARTLAARGTFCDLLAQAPLNLERNVSVDAVRAFKLAV